MSTALHVLDTINSPADVKKLSVEEMKQLAEESNAYLAAHKRWTNYFLFWKQGGRDHTAEQFSSKNGRDHRRIV